MNKGDLVERVMTTERSNALRARDLKKAMILGTTGFIGNAAAYLHEDVSYLVTDVTPRGGLVLEGFGAVVSQKEVRISTKPRHR